MSIETALSPTAGEQFHERRARPRPAADDSSFVQHMAAYYPFRNDAMPVAGAGRNAESEQTSRTPAADGRPGLGRRRQSRG